MAAVSGKMRNGIVLGLLAATVVALLVAYNLGQQQDRDFLKTYQMFQQAQALMQKQQYAQAEPLLKQVLAAQPHSFTVLWHYGLCEFGLKHYDEADRYFTEARKQRPFLLRDQLFLTQYGELLYRKGEMQRAKAYLQASVALNKEKDLTEQAKRLLAEMGKANG